jgi:hypothetical protein
MVDYSQCLTGVSTWTFRLLLSGLSPVSSSWIEMVTVSLIRKMMSLLKERESRQVILKL